MYYFYDEVINYDISFKQVHPIIGVLYKHKQAPINNFYLKKIFSDHADMEHIHKIDADKMKELYKEVKPILDEIRIMTNEDKTEYKNAIENGNKPNPPSTKDLIYRKWISDSNALFRNNSILKINKIIEKGLFMMSKIIQIYILLQNLQNASGNTSDNIITLVNDQNYKQNIQDIMFLIYGHNIVNSVIRKNMTSYSKKTNFEFSTSSKLCEEINTQMMSVDVDLNDDDTAVDNVGEIDDKKIWIITLFSINSFTCMYMLYNQGFKEDIGRYDKSELFSREKGSYEADYLQINKYIQLADYKGSKQKPMYPILKYLFCKYIFETAINNHNSNPNVKTDDRIQIDNIKGTFNKIELIKGQIEKLFPDEYNADKQNFGSALESTYYIIPAYNFLYDAEAAAQKEPAKIADEAAASQKEAAANTHPKTKGFISSLFNMSKPADNPTNAPAANKEVPKQKNKFGFSLFKTF